MAVVLDAAAGVDTVISLLGVAGGLVTAILQAREEVRLAPEKTQELLRTVHTAQSCLSRLEQAAGERPLWDLLELHLRELAKELVLALKKLRKFEESDARRQASNQALETAKAILGKGASSQTKKTVAITERLKGLLVSLDRAVLHDTHALMRETATRLMGDGGSTAAVAPVALPHPEHALPHPEHALVKRLLTIGARNDERLDLRTEVCEPGKDWRDAVPPVGRPVAGNRPVGFARRKRAAREGGYEVPSSTKVRFTMSVRSGKWSFYVLTYDGWENAEPQVFFPKTSSSKPKIINKCHFGVPRVFPSNPHYGDPISLKVERSRKVTDNGEGQVSVFLVLSTAPLHTDPLSAGDAQQITVQDIEQHMSSAEDLIVKRVLFDVSKGQ